MSASEQRRNTGGEASGRPHTRGEGLFAIGRPDSLRASFSCVSPRAHGEIVVVESRDMPRSFRVGWRRDRRFKRSIVGLSTHDDRQAAISRALSLSSRYVPDRKPLHNRPRDFQRSAVYEWELALSASRRPLPHIAAARALVDRLTSSFGIASAPVTVGGERLVHSSYFMPGIGIVLSPRMLDIDTVLHETAHFVVHRMRIREVSHGSAFAATLLALHAVHGDVTMAEGLASAAMFQVEINVPLCEGLFAIASGLQCGPAPSAH